MHQHAKLGVAAHKPEERVGDGQAEQAPPDGVPWLPPDGDAADCRLDDRGPGDECRNDERRRYDEAVGHRDDVHRQAGAEQADDRRQGGRGEGRPPPHGGILSAPLGTNAIGASTEIALRAAAPLPVLGSVGNTCILGLAFAGVYMLGGRSSWAAIADHSGLNLVVEPRLVRAGLSGRRASRGGVSAAGSQFCRKERMATGSHLAVRNLRGRGPSWTLFELCA